MRMSKHQRPPMPATIVFLIVLGSYLLSPLPASSVAHANEGDDTHTHFRFGHITWDLSGPETVDFRFIAGFRRCTEPGVGFAYSGSDPDGCLAVGDVFDEFIGGTELCFGDGGCTGQLRFMAFAINKAENLVLARALEPGNDAKQTITHLYFGGLGRSFTAFTATCCRILAPKHINNPSGSYRVEAIVNFTDNTANPVSLLPPIVNCPQNATCEFIVTALDIDFGARLRWRLSESDEAGPGFSQPGPPSAPNLASIESFTGLYTWNTTGASLNPDGETLYSTQVTIEDVDAQGNVISKSALDFLIRIVQIPPPPSLILIPVRWCGVRGSPSMDDPSTVSEDSRNNVLLARHARANGVFLDPDNRANLLFHSGLVSAPALSDFPIIDDPNPPTPGGTGAGELGDINIFDEQEVQLAINNCRQKWVAQAPGVTGVTAVHINKFVNLSGLTVKLGVAGEPAFSDLAEQLLKGWAIVIDSAYLLEDTPFRKRANDGEVLAHELGHALSLSHVFIARFGNLMHPVAEFVGVNLDEDQREQIRDQAVLHVPDRLTNPTLPPLGNTRVDTLGDVPDEEGFIDLNTLAFGIDQELETTIFAVSTFGVFPENISNLNFFFIADLDNDSSTGGSPADIGIPTTAQGIDLIGLVRVEVSDGVRTATPTVWRFQAGEFVEIVDASIKAEAVPDVAVIDACLEEEPVCEDEFLTLGELVKLQMSNSVAGTAAERFILETIGENPNTGIIDTATVEINLQRPQFPQCVVNPSGATLGSTVTIDSSGLPPNGTAEVFLDSQQVAIGLIDDTGDARIDLTIPEDTPTGVKPLMVVASDTAIAASCAINVVAIPAFDVPPSPPSGSTFVLNAGETLTIPIQASDADVGDVVTLGVLGLPTGASFPISTPANPVTSTFSWTPTLDQAGGHVIVFTAVDNIGLSSPPHSIAINVIQRIEVDIDIKPGGNPNSINPKSKGKIPVAILSTPDFDASTQVENDSLTFGRTGDEESLHRRGNDEPNCDVEDVNDDGLRDLVCHFNTQDSGFQAGDTEGILKGQTGAGFPIIGTDSVAIVP